MRERVRGRAAGQGRLALGLLLRSHRIMAGLSQEELADKSGLSVRAISNIERATTARPYASSIRLLADALRLAGPARANLMRARFPAAGPPPVACGGLPGAGAPRSAPVIAPVRLAGARKGFAGREAELNALTDAYADAAAAGTVMISAIGGAPGAGKTALALHWAQQMAVRFPDGQLHTDLRGFGSAGGAAEPARVISGFLDAIGVPATRIPHGLADRAALYRSMLAGRRVLVLLDNARDEQQVRPLLPGSAGCAALVTSRRPLTGLIAIEGARSVTVVMPAVAEARERPAPRASATAGVSPGGT